MTKRLTYSFAVICLVAGCLHAALAITGEIPVPFHFRNSILPAGSYRTDARIDRPNSFPTHVSFFRNPPVSLA
jgi:hypothetical protein